MKPVIPLTRSEQVQFSRPTVCWVNRDSTRMSTNMLDPILQVSD